MCGERSDQVARTQRLVLRAEVVSNGGMVVCLEEYCCGDEGERREWISMVGQGQWTPQAPETGTKVGAETKASRAWEGDEQGGQGDNSRDSA